MHPSELAEKFSDKPAIIIAETGGTLTFRELDDISMKVSQFFRSLGLKRGDHIAILLENHPMMLPLCLAAQRAGLYFTTISYRLQQEEVQYIVEDCQARVFITSRSREAVAEKLNLSHCDKICMLDGVIAGFEPLEDAVAAMPAEKIADESIGSSHVLFQRHHRTAKGCSEAIAGRRIWC